MLSPAGVKWKNRERDIAISQVESEAVAVGESLNPRTAGVCRE